MYALLKSKSSFFHSLLSESEQKYEGLVVLPNTSCCVGPGAISFHSDVDRDSKRSESLSGPSG